MPTRRGMCELQKKTNIKPASSFDNFKSNNPRFWHILKLNVILVAKLRKKRTFCGTKNLTTPILLVVMDMHVSPLNQYLLMEQLKNMNLDILTVFMNIQL